MREQSTDADPLAWTDVVLAVMGLVLVGAFAVGALSSVPFRVAGSVGSVIATAAWVGSVAVNPDGRGD
jgi:hypothetical protein